MLYGTISLKFNWVKQQAIFFLGIYLLGDI